MKPIVSRKLKIVLAIILLVSILIPIVASAAGLSFFGGKIKRRFSPSSLSITLLEIKGPPDSIVIVAGTMLGFGCRQGQIILGWGVKVSRGILNIFSFCGLSIGGGLGF